MEKDKGQFIELRQLRYFIALAEELHSARAAERLRMQQSPLSRAIRELEGILGVRLFERSTRSTRLTRAGAVLLNHARRALELVERAGTSARSAALGHSNQLRVGVSDCTAYCRVMEVLAHYRLANRDIAVSLHEMPLTQQISQMRDDLLDACISIDGSDREGIQVQAIARDSICAAVATTHPLAHGDMVVSSDLVRYPLILFSAESDLGAGSLVDDFLESIGRPRVAFHANSLGTMLTLVALEHGVGLIGSQQMAGARRRNLLIRPISGAAPPLITYVLHSRCGVSEPLDAFIQLARKLLADVGQTSGPS